MPTRAVIAIMLFTCCFVSYVNRLQMPILAISMVNTTQINADLIDKREFALFSDKPFYWSAHVRGL